MAGRVIEILNFQTNLKNQKKKGTWEEIWASRPDIIEKVEIYKEYHGPHLDIPDIYYVDYAEIYVKYNILREDDFIFRKLYWQLDKNETKILLVAGKIPTSNFAKEWKVWAKNPAVQKSVVKYLVKVAKILDDLELKNLILYASRKTAKYRIMDAWEEVEKRFAALGVLAYQPKHTTTWTGVLAMPIKIARAISIPDFPRWHPPVPPPKYTPCGVLIASGKIPGYIAYGSEKEVGT